MFKSKKALNGVIDTVKNKLPDLLKDTGMTFKGVEKGKQPLFDHPNKVIVSGKGFKPDANGDRKYQFEVWFVLSHEKPEKLEENIMDFSDCLTELFEENHTLLDTCDDVNVYECFWFGVEKQIHLAVGKLIIGVDV